MHTDSGVRWVPVREVGEVRMGKQLSPSGREAVGQFPYLRVANVYEGHIDYSDVKTMAFSSAERELYGLKPGDILLNEGQENLHMVGRSALYSGPPGACCFQNTLIRFRPGPQVLPEYAQAVFVWWRAQGVFAGVAEKTSISHLGGSRFGALQFPLRRLADQRRIVEVRDAVSAQERVFEAAIDKLNKLQAAAVAEFAVAERGTFEEVLKFGPQNGMYKSVESYDLEGTPIVRIDSFAGGPSDLTHGLLRVSLNAEEIERYRLATGEILINRVNSLELVGKSTAVTRLLEPTVFESNIMRCRIDASKADPKFVEVWLGSKQAKDHFRQRAKSAISQASINGDDVRKCPFPRLSLAEQSAFVARLSAIRGQRQCEEAELAKLRKIKQGLVGDLLE